jgi:phage-related protein
MHDLTPKKLFWMGSSLKDLKTMPGEIQDDFGFALYQAQLGMKGEKTKVLKGFGSAGVLEVVTSGRGSTYRAVYTVRFTDAVYVLHCFQKKSKQGISTPKSEMELIRNRLKEAETLAKRGRI